MDKSKTIDSADSDTSRLSFNLGIVLSDSEKEDEDPYFYLHQNDGWRSSLHYLTPKKYPSTFDQATILCEGKEDTRAFLNIRADYPREDEKIVILGFFPDFSGPEYFNFLHAAYKLDMDYHFCITKKPPPDSGHVVRWFNLLDKRFEPIKITDVDDLVKYVEEKSTPYYTIYNVHPRRYVNKFLHSDEDKVALFIDLDRHDAEDFKLKFDEVAKINRGKETLFMLGGLDAIKPLSCHFGDTKSEEPRIVFKDSPRQIFVKEGLKHDDIKTWVEKDRKDGDSLPIPFHLLNFISDTRAFVKKVLRSRKNVFLVLYGSRRSDRLHLPVELFSLFLDLAVHFEKENEKDKEVVVAIVDRKCVAVPIRDVDGGCLPSNVEFLKALDPAKKSLVDWKNPTLCFKPVKGDLMLYDDAIEEEHIIRYINKNKIAEEPKRVKKTRLMWR
jgi:hypothetical protein